MSSRTYHQFNELPVRAKFVDNFGHSCVKTGEGTSAHCFETPGDDWYYHASVDRP